MNRDVTISVTGTQDSGGQKITTRCRSDGQYYEKNGCRYLLYREQDPESGAVTANTLKIKGSLLELSRKGNVHTRMVFETGRIHPADYVTAYGTLHLEVDTKDVTCLWTESAVRIIIIYHLLMAGECLSGNRLVIEAAESEKNSAKD